MTQIISMALVLSWPPAQLTPNSRCHWAQKARVAKRARGEAYVLARAYLSENHIIFNPKAVEKISIEYTFTPPDRRARDDDNLIAAMKPYRDGIAQALGMDDNCFRTQEAAFASVPRRPAFVCAHIRIEVRDD